MVDYYRKILRTKIVLTKPEYGKEDDTWTPKPGLGRLAYIDTSPCCA